MAKKKEETHVITRQDDFEDYYVVIVNDKYYVAKDNQGNCILYTLDFDTMGNSYNVSHKYSLNEAKEIAKDVGGVVKEIIDRVVVTRTVADV